MAMMVPVWRAGAMNDNDGLPGAAGQRNGDRWWCDGNGAMGAAAAVSMQWIM